MSRRKPAPPAAPEYPPSIFDHDPSELNGRVPTTDNPAPIVMRCRKLITAAWFLQLQDAASSYVQRKLRAMVKEMALPPIVMLHTATNVGNSANNPLPFSEGNCGKLDCLDLIELHLLRPAVAELQEAHEASTS